MAPVSNTAMNPTDDIEKRLIELEIKASLADDLLDQLNETVFRQQRMIEFLTRELTELRQQQGPDASGAGLSRNLRDELPPHY